MIPDSILYGLSRIKGLRTLLFKRSIPRRVRYGLWTRPAYAYGVYQAADLAVRLGLPAISVVELGVAGGRGLIALEQIASEIGPYFGIQVSVFGFDAGGGLPPPVDYRDIPYVWEGGFYEMDEAKLRARLKHATLVLGNVVETIPKFVESKEFPPIGFIAFDLDYYSSTMAAFSLFAGPAHLHLPRVYCYFDNLMWPDLACHNEYIGELCAIRDFNLEHEFQKISPIYGLRYRMPHLGEWTELIYVFHDFGHPLYTKHITARRAGDTSIPL